ncbi:glycine-rich domain-containing protein [Xanthobacter sp. ZOL 2024]
MATNDYLPFGTATGANAISTSAYNSLAARLTGFAAGVALSQQVNKPLRQTSSIAAMIGAFIAAAGYDALDDGDQTTLLANYELALKKIIEDNLPDTVDLSGYLLKSGGTMTGLLKAPAGLQTTSTTLTASTILTTADSGKFVEITAASQVVTRLPTPIGNGGVNYTFWANSVSAQKIRTQDAGVFQGPGASLSADMIIPAGGVYTVCSDGYNWVLVGAVDVPAEAVATSSPRMTCITSSGTWTKRPGSTYAVVLVQGAGGAGGGTNALTNVASGGGAGSFSASLISLDGVTSVTCTIAAGGVPVDGHAGSAGSGMTSFGTLVTAAPGEGGFNTYDFTEGSGQTSLGGSTAGTVGQYRQTGNAGNRAAVNGGGTGAGAAGLFGGAGSGGLYNEDGYGGRFGGGGGGGSGGIGMSTTKGGGGGSGIIIVIEW